MSSLINFITFFLVNVSHYSSNFFPWLLDKLTTEFRIVYERAFLMNMRNSPLAKTPPNNMPNIPGFFLLLLKYVFCAAVIRILCSCNTYSVQLYRLFTWFVSKRFRPLTTVQDPIPIPCSQNTYQLSFTDESKNSLSLKTSRSSMGIQVSVTEGKIFVLNSWD